MKIKVGVLFGGATVEHEISIISAVQAMNHLNPDKYEIIPIYLGKNRIWYTGKMLMDIEVYKDIEMVKRYAKEVMLCNKNGTFVLQATKGIFQKKVAELDLIFPIVHGNNVEDGTLQGFLEAIGIPYVGSSVLGSALGQDKVVMKQVMKEEGLPIIDYTWFYDSEYLEDTERILKEIKKIGYPLIVKPATLGSSIGITFVKNHDEIISAINEAIRYDNKIIVEKAVEDLTEVNCSVLGNYEYSEASVLEEVMGTEEFLTYQDKYLGSKKGGNTKGMVSTDRIIPARLDEKMTEEIRSLAQSVCQVLNLSGVTRVDFLIDKKKNKVYVNEPNTIPGSLSFYLWEATGKSYEQLLDEMISLGIKEYKRKNKKIVSFDTNILNNFNGTKGCKGLKACKK